ncbi:MAG TPA: hypothetical protein VNS59_01445, partial [Lysobacter sp.]|nr:hypothetical protein [Lysobacter sp.]
MWKKARVDQRGRSGRARRALPIASLQLAGLRAPPACAVPQNATAGQSPPQFRHGSFGREELVAVHVDQLQ